MALEILPAWRNRTAKKGGRSGGGEMTNSKISSCSIAFKSGKRILTLTLFIAALLLGCAPLQVKDNFQQNYDFSKIKSVVIMPFYQTSTDSLNMAYIQQKFNGLNYDAIDVISIQLMNTDVKVIDRMLIEKILTEQALSISGATSGQDYQKIGKLVDADVIIYGNLTLNKAFADRNGKISVRMVDVETGTMVYSAFGEKKDMCAACSISAVANDLIQEVANKISKVFLENKQLRRETSGIKD
jgi:curli biogenesis system outer membrane secretion channel CsgG